MACERVGRVKGVPPPLPACAPSYCSLRLGRERSAVEESDDLAALHLEAVRDADALDAVVALQREDVLAVGDGGRQTREGDLAAPLVLRQRLEGEPRLGSVWEVSGKCGKCLGSEPRLSGRVWEIDWESVGECGR